MEKVDIINESYEEIKQIFAAKKLKTRGADFDNLKEAAKVEVVKEEEVPFEEPIKEEPMEVVEEVKDVEPEFNFDVEDFAYGNTKKEEDIDSDEISRIKDEIANKYKDPVVKEEIKPIIKEEVKPIVKMSKEDFESALNKNSYSAKINAFKISVSNAYSAIVQKINAKQAEIDEITGKYSNETEITGKLQVSQKDVQGTITGINSLNLDFLTTKKDEESRNVLVALELLFNKNREILNQIVQELKNSAERKEGLGKEEQRAREEIARFKEELYNFMEEKFPLVEEANATDDKVRKTDEEVAKLTGFKEDPVLDNDTQRKAVFNVSNLNEEKEPVVVEPVITVNRFDDLRQDEQEFGGRGI